MQHIRMEQVGEVSLGMSLSFHLLVFLISSMLTTLVPFLLKIGNLLLKKCSHDSEFVLPVKDELGDFNYF